MVLKLSDIYCCVKQFSCQPRLNRWRAPETFLTGDFSTKSDVYSFGLVLYEIVVQKEPFYHINEDNEITAQVHIEGLEIPNSMHTCFKKIIEGCCKSDPNNRDTMKQVVELLEQFSLLTIL